MLKLPQKEVSLLKPEGFRPTYPGLKSDIEIDTVVVGGGIVGITTAYLLKKAGQKVAVLEKDAIGSGTTGHTTGKVTSQHNLMYADMYERFGEKKTRLYGEANQAAIEQIDKLIKDEKLDCGWQRADNYVYTANKKLVDQFRLEAKIAVRLGLPATFQKTSPLPFKIAATVRFADQAHFSAQKYIEGLARTINQNGSHIYEQTQATGFNDGSPGAVLTSEAKVTARDIIVATNVPTWPLLARGAYCVLEYPQNSYIVAGRPKIKLDGMYISPDKNHYSLLPVGKGKDQTLLVGGENHIPGLGRAEPRHQKLADYAEHHFGVSDIKYRWHARDYLAYDNFPLIGKLYPWSEHIYVATAFKKWGPAHSMVAAKLLRDLIAGQKNEWLTVYDSTRMSPVKYIPRTFAQYFSDH
ncbi:MAG TPA: FAD-binding oxidoreductase [Candidatus Saccharimonadales bacterium]|nr:FAD-binding oxidoreductase [Candidatus Saccharimonadales bacterium]